MTNSPAHLFGNIMLFGDKLLYLYKSNLMVDYRKIWENSFGPIPKDDAGRSYHIHHVDGDRNNNDIGNLQCLSIAEHYQLHLDQYNEKGKPKDLAAAKFLAGTMGKTSDELKGYSVSTETRAKISKSLTGRKRDPLIVEKIKQTIKTMGKKPTQDAIEARRAGMKEYYKQASKEELEVRWKKIGEAHTGKDVKEVTKTKLGKASAKLTDEEALQVAAMIEDGVRYKTISQKYGISQSQITSIKQKKTYKWLWN